MWDMIHSDKSSGIYKWEGEWISLEVTLRVQWLGSLIHLVPDQVQEIIMVGKAPIPVEHKVIAVGTL